MKYLRRFFIFILGLTLLIISAVAVYGVYIDSNTSAAKTYLVERYELKEDKIKPVEYIRYVYEDVTNCESLWFKKCTSDENLLYQYIFEYDDEKITVSEDKKGKLTDDYPHEAVNEEKQDNDKEEVSD